MHRAVDHLIEDKAQNLAKESGNDTLHGMHMLIQTGSHTSQASHTSGAW